MISIQKIANRFFKGHKRTVKAKKHIAASFVLKGLTILISFIMVPLTLDYVQKEQYGIWLVLSSILEWFTFFDIGLGSGLRNKLGESFARGNIKRGKMYVSTAYTLLAVIFGSILLLFYLVNPFLDWNQILNAPNNSSGELAAVAVVTFTFFIVRFVLQLIFAVFYADQRPSIQAVINLVRKVLILITLIILIRTTEGSLFNLAFTFGFYAVLVLLVVSIYFYRRDYKAISPSIYWARKAAVKDLFNLSVNFFIIGLSVLVIFTTDNFIITRLFGPSEVPAYNIAHRYFGLITIGFGIICVPFWSAFTEAYAKNDIPWIKRTIKSLIKIWGGFLGLGIIMLLGSGIFFKLWVPEIEVPFQLSCFMLIYVLIHAWGNIFVNFINGVNKIRLQLVVAVIGALLNIPLSIFFAIYCGLGTSGVILASTICVLYGPLLAPIQYKKIINGTARGIWNK